MTCREEFVAWRARQPWTVDITTPIANWLAWFCALSDETPGVSMPTGRGADLSRPVAGEIWSRFVNRSETYPTFLPTLEERQVTALEKIAAVLERMAPARLEISTEKIDAILRGLSGGGRAGE